MLLLMALFPKFALTLVRNLRPGGWGARDEGGAQIDRDTARVGWMGRGGMRRGAGAPSGKQVGGCIQAGRSCGAANQPFKSQRAAACTGSDAARAVADEQHMLRATSSPLAQSSQPPRRGACRWSASSATASGPSKETSREAKGGKRGEGKPETLPTPALPGSGQLGYDLSTQASPK